MITQNSNKMSQFYPKCRPMLTSPGEFLSLKRHQKLAIQFLQCSVVGLMSIDGWIRVERRGSIVDMRWQAIAVTVRLPKILFGTYNVWRADMSLTITHLLSLAYIDGICMLVESHRVICFTSALRRRLILSAEMLCRWSLCSATQFRSFLAAYHVPYDIQRAP